MQIKLRTVIFFLVLFLLLIFAAINWPAFAAPTPLNILIGTVVAPLGVVMLAVVAGLTLLYLLVLGKVETGALLGNRRTAKELEEARRVAMSAEESRIHELREELDERLDRIEATLNELAERKEAAPRRATDPVVIPPREEIV